jgi:hypothetical protein
LAKPEQLPTSQRQDTPLPQHRPETTRDFYVKARSGKKRDYIYDVIKAGKCPHPRMVALSIGGNWYRCEECNYAFDIVAAYAQPVHNLVIGSMLNTLHFAKEYGANSLQEVLRTAIGQYDGTPQKPVLPEGMSFEDTLEALESVNVNTEDGGDKQLKALVDNVWVTDEARTKRLGELPYDSDGSPHPEEWKALPKEMPSVPLQEGAYNTNGHTGESRRPSLPMRLLHSTIHRFTRRRS